MFGIGKRALGGIVFGIFMLALFGARSANNWRPNSAQETTAERIAAGSNNASDTADSTLAARENPDRFNSQSDGIFDNQTINQADRPNSQFNSANNDNSAAGEALTYPALDEAGSYIQRQKRVEEDDVIADTTFNVIPNAEDAPVASSSDSRVPDQPSEPEQPPSSGTDTPLPNPAPPDTTPSPSAVPALW